LPVRLATLPGSDVWRCSHTFPTCNRNGQLSCARHVWIVRAYMHVAAGLFPQNGRHPRIRWNRTWSEIRGENGRSVDSVPSHVITSLIGHIPRMPQCYHLRQRDQRRQSRHSTGITHYGGIGHTLHSSFEGADLGTIARRKALKGVCRLSWGMPRC
jgi:hypothetical protein